MQAHQPLTFLPWSPISLTFHRGSDSSNFAMVCENERTRGQVRAPSSLDDDGGTQVEGRLPTRAVSGAGASESLQSWLRAPARVSARNAQARKSARNTTSAARTAHCPTVAVPPTTRRRGHGASAPGRCASAPESALAPRVARRAARPPPAPALTAPRARLLGAPARSDGSSRSWSHEPQPD